MDTIDRILSAISLLLVVMIISAVVELLEVTAAAGCIAVGLVLYLLFGDNSFVAV